VRIPGLKTLRRTGWRIRGAIFGHGAVLGYHRIAEDAGDPWGNCLAPAVFAEHMDVLQREFRPTRLADVASPRDHTHDHGRRTPIAVTFDDGYSEVLHEALPILEKHDIPATVFLVSDAAGSVFWWDRLRLVLEEPVALPATMDLNIAGADIRWGAGEGVQALYGALHKALHGLPTAAVEDALLAVEAWAGPQRARPTETTPPRLPRTLDEGEILELAAHPLVELGSHGATHRALPGLSGQALHEEIEGSRRRLEDLLSRPVGSFSYPFGLLDDGIRMEVARKGYHRACTSWNGLIARGADPLNMPRIWPPSVNGEVMRRWLRGWTGR
jgi:peptidoglycan/xylan/chitin deacetylase (PgdA/CDA1 family)